MKVVYNPLPIQYIYKISHNTPQKKGPILGRHRRMNVVDIMQRKKLQRKKQPGKKQPEDVSLWKCRVDSPAPRSASENKGDGSGRRLFWSGSVL